MIVRGGRLSKLVGRLGRAVGLDAHLAVTLGVAILCPWRSSNVTTSIVDPARVTTRRLPATIPPSVTRAWSDSSARSPV
jgi:hypothetical protein